MRRSPAVKRRAARLGAAAALLLLFSAPASWAQPPVFEVEDLWPVDEYPSLRLEVGRGELLTLPSDVDRVALADDKLARPQVISSREVLLTGLTPGRTTVFVWLVSGERLKYPLQVVADLELGLVRRTLVEIDPRIVVEPSADGGAVVLRGEVTDLRAAREAVARARSLLDGRARVLDLLRFPGYTVTAAERLEARLAEALEEIDPRIEVRRLQVGAEPDPAMDTFVLEGRVRDIHALKRAVTLAERQLGGTGSEVKAAGEERLRFQRTQGFIGSTGGGGGGFLQGAQPPPAGLSSKVARGLVVTSESGRVVSFLEVDVLPQVLVSIRVVEVDRTKAKKAGINLRFDNENVSIGSYLSPQVESLPSATGGVTTGTARTPRRSLVRPGPDIGAITGTNLVGAFVDKVTSVVAAIDFLEDKALARSVAEPNVLTLSGEPATVVVGGEVPIPTSTVNQVAAVQGFFFQNFGVRLDIRPTVVADELIALEVVPSIIRRSIALGVGDVPGFQVQSVQTTARVQAGESLVLGGLLTFEEGLEERKIPGLGWLPGVGRWRRKSRNERELLFIISPQIVETPRSAAPVDPVTMPDLDTVELPELDWPDGRSHWRDDFEPQRARPDGVPPAFLPPEAYPPIAPPPAPPTVAPPTAAPPLAAPPMAAPPTAAPPTAALPTAAGDPSAPESEAAPELAWDEAEAEVEMPQGPEIWIVEAYPCLNLREETGTWQKPLDCLPSNTRVEILREEEGGWTRVRLADGREGWVAGDYLVPILPDQPAAQLDLLRGERDQLLQRVEAAEEGDEGLQEQLRQIQEEIDRIRAESSGGEEPPP